MSWAPLLLILAVALPGVIFALLALAWLLGWVPSERLVARMTDATFLLTALAMAGACRHLGSGPVLANAGDWFSAGSYHFPLVLMADPLSAAFLIMTVVLAGIAARFSVTYLHREPGYLRFFLLLHLFVFGSLLMFAAGSLELLVAGWELVGITSVLLIAFFHLRAAPVDNALRVFAIYHGCDMGLLVGIFALEHWGTGTAWTQAWPVLSAGHATVLGLLLLLAAAGKAAQVPFSSWLPRAMEGPTPSSAIFYGALSIHAGPFLLLRLQPLFAHSHAAAAAIIATGAATALYGTLCGRASADAKTALAFASLSQVGLILIEIGLGLRWLAVLHTAGHAGARMVQLLRAPSALHDHHQMRAALGETPEAAHRRPGRRSALHLWLYRWALDRGHLDTLLDDAVAAPLLWTSHALAALEGGACRAAGVWRQPGEATSRAGLPSPARAATAWRACRQSTPVTERPAGATQQNVASHQPPPAPADTTVSGGRFH